MISISQLKIRQSLSLQSLKISGGGRFNKSLSSQQFGDFKYKKITGNHAAITGYTGNAKSVVIPEKIAGLMVQEIAAGVFDNNENIQDVKFSKYIERIGNRAFHNCKNLTAISFNNALLSIGENAFSSCPSLLGINLPPNLKSTGKSAFSSCTALSTVNLNDKLESIGESAFSSCTALVNVNFNNNLQSIGRDAFYSCSSITKLDLPDSVHTIGDSAFKNCTSLKEFKYPLNLANVRNLGYGSLFHNCPNLKKIVVPEGVVNIPDHTFSDDNSDYVNASYIEEIVLPSTLKTIGRYAFHHQRKLSKINIPASVSLVGDNAFSGCRQIKSLEFTNLIEVGSYAFSDMPLLSNIKLGEKLTTLGSVAFSGNISLVSVTLPDSLKSIGESVFYNCTNLTNTNYPKSLETGKYMFNGCKKLEHISVPDGVKHLPESIFAGSSYLKTSSLPATLVSIGRDAFYSCSSIRKLDLPDSVHTIGDSAFKNCTSLKEFKYPLNLANVRNLGYGSLFHNCPNLKKIVVPEGVVNIPAHTFSDDNSDYVNASYIEEIVLPSTLKTIGKYAFHHQRKLSKINIPASVSSVGDNAFRGLKSLRAIKTPKNLTVIPKYMFSDSDKLERIELSDEVVEIGDGAFANCESLREINYPSKLKKVGSSENSTIFDNCKSLATVNIPESVEHIPANTFNNAKFLRYINLPKNLKTVGMRAFKGYRGFLNVILPDKTKRIEEHAYADCYNLMSVSIPDSVDYIAKTAFDNCPKLYINSNENSYASIYAANNQIPYMPDANNKNPNSIFDRNKTTYVVNTMNLSAAGNLNFELLYTFKESAIQNIKDASLEIKLPSGGKLIKKSVSKDGKIVTDYTENEGTLNFRVDPKTTTSSVISFSIKPEQASNIISYARIHFTQSNEKKAEVLGVISEAFDSLSINALDELNEAKFEVDGVAPPKTKIDLYIGDSKVASTVSNSAGVYRTNITLDNPKDYQMYTIFAKTITSSGKNLLASKEIVFNSKASVLKNFTMRYRGKEYDLKKLSGVRPVITFDGGEFEFDLEFTNPEKLAAVFVGSERTNSKKYIEAKWNESKGKFVAKGVFDPENSRYVPGKISVEFTEKEQEVDFTSEYDYNSDKHKSTLTKEVREILSDTQKYVTVESIEKDGVNTLKGEINPPKSKAKIKYEYITYDISGEITKNNYKKFGYHKVSDSRGNNLYLKFEESLSSKIKTKMIDFAKGKVVDMSIDAINTATGLSMPLDSILGLADQYMTSVEHETTVSEIEYSILNNRGLTREHKRESLDLIVKNRLYNQTALYARAITSIAYVAAFATGTVISSGVALIPLAVIEFSNLLSKLSMLKLKNLYAKKYDGIAMNFRWKIDPSGYVYEAVTNKRLSGVLATAYHKETQNSEEVLWDAKDWDQQNPLITDFEGRYAWDVPEGLWQVRFTLDGYEDAKSDWLPVPPEQKNVNIAMVSKEIPNVLVCSEHGDYIKVLYSKYMKPETIGDSSIKVIDKEGKKVEFDVEYSKDEKSENGTIYAKEYLLKFKSTYTQLSDAKYKLEINSNAKSYAGVGAKNLVIDASKGADEIAPTISEIEFKNTTASSSTLNFKVDEKSEYKVVIRESGTSFDEKEFDTASISAVAEKDKRESVVLKDLKSNTSYDVYIKAQDYSKNASIKKVINAFKTTKEALIAELNVSIDSPRYADEIKAIVKNVNTRVDKLEYKWFRGNVQITEQNQSVYKISKDDIGNKISFSISSPDREGELRAKGTNLVKRALNTNTPDAPKKDVVKSSSISLQGIEELEFSRDKKNWQGNKFTNLKANTSYVFYARYKKTETHEASESSPSSIEIKTNDKVKIKSISKVDLIDLVKLNGRIEIVASGGSGELEYSIDGGQTFKDENVFENLKNSKYSILVRDKNDHINKSEIHETIITAPGEFSVSYNHNYSGGKVEVEKVKANEKATTRTATRIGYAFKNWSEDAKGNVTWSFDTIIKENKTLYAIWQVEKLKGDIKISSASKARFGDVLSVELVNSNNSGELSYKWYADSNLLAETKTAQYEISENEIGKLISVGIVSSEQTGELRLDLEHKVEKARRKAPKPPKEKNVEFTRISIESEKTKEYSIRRKGENSKLAWKNTKTEEMFFDGLLSGQVYEIYSRYIETKTHLSSEISEVLRIKTRELSLQSLEIEREPEKKTYKKGEKLELKGLEIIKKLNDGSAQKAEISELDFSIKENEVLNAVGKLKVIIKLDGKTVEFEIEVKDNEEKPSPAPTPAPAPAPGPAPAPAPAPSPAPSKKTSKAKVEKPKQKEESKENKKDKLFDKMSKKISIIFINKALNSFRDISNHWAKTEIGKAISLSLLNGVSKDTFAPDLPANRAMVVTILSRMVDKKELASRNKFIDLKKDSWYEEHVNWAANSSIVSGVSKDRFDPEGLVTREQLAIMIFRFAKHLNIDIPKGYENESFSDMSEISKWALDGVRAMKKMGIITGRKDGKFDPKANATRAEISVMIMRLLEK